MLFFREDCGTPIFDCLNASDRPSHQAPPLTAAQKAALEKKQQQRRITQAPIAANKVANASASVEGLTRRPAAAAAVSAGGKSDGGAAASSASSASSSNAKDE
jgi:hypothetical protein